MSYKWKAGDWARCGQRVWQVTQGDIDRGVALVGDTGYTMRAWIPVIVRDKPQPKKVKRSELRAWFERQMAPCATYNPVRSCGAWYVTTNGGAHYAYGPTLEAAIIALRKALRKAGKFTP